MPFIGTRGAASSRGFGQMRTPPAGPPPATYTIATGTKAPTLGAGGASPYPSTGWTSVQNSSVDDGYQPISIVSNLLFDTVNYSTVYVGSNTYITMGGGSSNYSGLSASNPSLPKFMTGAADNSYQRVEYISSGTNYTRVRYEGNGSTSGTPGSPGIVYEATFFNSTLTNFPTVEFLFGNNNRTGPGIIIATASTALATATLSANQSYVFQANATGTAWTIYTGSYMAGTGY
jgi:hypothetical protein